MHLSVYSRKLSSCGTSTSGRPWSTLDCCSSSLKHRHCCSQSRLSHFQAANQLLKCCQRVCPSAVQLPGKGVSRQKSSICTAVRNSNGTGNKGPVIVIDNYDSFTYNLCQYLGDLGCEHVVYKNDEKTVDELRELNPRGILLSPGPGRPEDSGIALQTVQELGSEFPIFGVCMGHQCIGQVFGGNIIKAPSGVMHGKTSPVHHTNQGLMKGLSNPFLAARYHSLVIAEDSVPDVLEVTAWTEDGTIMAVQHKQHSHIQGVQFHPESIITDNGRQVVKNFIDSLD